MGHITTKPTCFSVPTKYPLPPSLNTLSVPILSLPHFLYSLTHSPPNHLRSCVVVHSYF